MHRVNRIGAVAAIADGSALAFSVGAAAQGVDDGVPAAGDETPSETAASAPSTGREIGASASTALGSRYRGVLSPELAMGWFVAGDETVYVDGAGPELSVPDGDCEHLLGTWRTFGSMSPAAFEGADYSL